MIARADLHRRSSHAHGDRPRTLRIALLGCGTVGGAAARLLLAQRERIRASCGVDLQLIRILVRDTRKSREGLDAELFTTRLADVLAAEPDIVIEALGGREPAATFLEQVLARGVSVVSANKTAIAHDGPRLQAIADRSGARLAYEACVGAAVPVLAALRQRGAAGVDPLISLRAVVNGTCNFALGRMRETGQTLDIVLGDAISRGLAEPDPTADISGRDSAEKLCILAREAGFGHITPADVEVTGIEHITPRDLDAAREHGCVIRLLAEMQVHGTEFGAAREGTAISLRVCPMFVPLTNPLAKARGAENVFVIEQHFARRLVLQGEGAGPSPTASAILGDVLGLVSAGACIARRDGQKSIVRRAAASRSFVRLPRAHEAAAEIQRAGAQVHLRREALEAIVEGGVAVESGRDSLVAPVLPARLALPRLDPGNWRRLDAPKETGPCRARA